MNPTQPPTQGCAHRVDDGDRISYLHQPMRYGRGMKPSMEMSHRPVTGESPEASVSLFKDDCSRIQMTVQLGGFHAALHISPYQARQLAMALAEAAADADRLTMLQDAAGGTSAEDFMDSTWPATEGAPA